MGQAGLGAGNHDGIKSKAGGAILVQAVDQLRLEFQFRHAGLDSGDNLGESLIGDILGLAHDGKLPFLLHTTEAVNLLVVGHQLGVQVLFIHHKLRHGQVRLLIAQAGHAEISNGGVQALGIAAALGNIQDLKAFDAVFGSLGIAVVGEIAAALLGDDGNALGDVILGTVVAGVTGCQQQTVHFAFQQGQVLIKILHMKCSFFLQDK